MQSETSNQTATSNSGLIKFFVERLPAHLRRMIYLASISGVASETREPNDEFVGKLNTILNLSDTGPSALKLPIFVSGLIWTHQGEIEQHLRVLKDPNATEHDRQECIDVINTKTSSWLKYADAQTIKRDLCALFNPQNHLFSK